jgi:hypothetical protein
VRDPDQVFGLLVSANPVPEPREVPGDVALAPGSIGEDRPTAVRQARRWAGPAIGLAAALGAIALAVVPGLLSGEDPGGVAGETTTSSSTGGDVSTTMPPPQGGLADRVAMVASGEGIDLVVEGRDAVTRLLEGPVSVAVHAGSGDVVFQWATSGVPDAGIHLLRRGALDPEVLVAARPDVWVRLFDVVEIGDGRVVVYVERRDYADPATTTEWLMEYDLETGARSEVGQVAGSERAVEAVSWDGSRYVVETLGDGLVLFSTVGRDGTVRPWTGTLPHECTIDGPCPRFRLATPDGLRLVFMDGDDLVSWDRSRDAEDGRRPLPAGTSDTVTGLRVEWPAVIVNRSGTTALVADMASMAWSELPVAGTASLAGVVGQGTSPDTPSNRAWVRVDGAHLEVVGVCAGVDGAVVVDTAEGLRVIAGFEEGRFLRVIDQGVGVETSLLEHLADGGDAAQHPAVSSGRKILVACPVRHPCRASR